MKHKHAEFIHLMANGVRIETAVNGEWIGAYWGDFNDNNLTFRISPNQPADKDGWIQWRDITHYRIVKEKAKKWRWMYAVATNNTYDSLYLTAPMTEAEAKAWVSGRVLTTLGPRQDWTEVCDE